MSRIGALLVLAWENRFRYYFDAKEKPLKYLKATTHPDAKEDRQGIIFNPDGKY